MSIGGTPDYEDQIMKMHGIRKKYGYDSVKRCIMLLNTDLSKMNPIADNTVYPGGFVY